MFQDAAGVSIVIFMDYRNNPLFYQGGRVAEVSVCIRLFTKFPHVWGEILRQRFDKLWINMLAHCLLRDEQAS